VGTLHDLAECAIVNDVFHVVGIHAAQVVKRDSPSLKACVIRVSFTDAEIAQAISKEAF